MHLLAIRRPARAACLLLFAVGVASCGDGRVSPLAPDALHPARAGNGGGPKVDAVDPPFGRQGDTAKEVAITGSGFGDDAVVAWERDGVVEERIRVRSTEVRSSTEILVTIDIDQDADLDLYDISVTSSRKKGIGTELFEVTAAISIGTLGGATLSRGVNDGGEVVGYSVVETATRPFYWSPSSGMVELPGTPAGGAGAGWAIDAAGTVIAGIVAQYPVAWTRNLTTGTWEIAHLPVNATSPGGRASSIASDPTTGEASIIGGVERVEHGRRVVRRPRLWVRDQEAAGGWSRIVLEVPSTDASVWVEDVNASGVAVGTMLPLSGKPGQDQAVVWEANGRPSVIGPASSGAEGIDEAGTLIVGRYDGLAAYWRRDPNEPDGWAGPFGLPGECSRAMAADAAGRIIAARCRDNTRTTSAVFQPPSYSSPLYLGGLGEQNTGGVADAMSLSGGWIAGGASLNGQDYAVVWQIF